MSFDQSWLTIGGMTMLVMAAVQFTKRVFPSLPSKFYPTCRADRGGSAGSRVLRSYWYGTNRGGPDRGGSWVFGQRSLQPGESFDPRQIAAGCFRRPGQVARALNSASRSPSSTPSSRATRCSRAASRASSRSNL